MRLSLHLQHLLLAPLHHLLLDQGFHLMATPTSSSHATFKSLHCKFLHCQLDCEGPRKFGEVLAFLILKFSNQDLGSFYVRFARPACPNCSSGCNWKVKVSRREDFNARGRRGAQLADRFFGGAGGEGGCTEEYSAPVGSRPLPALPGVGRRIHPPILYFLFM